MVKYFMKFHEIVHMLDTLNSTSFYSFTFCWSFLPYSLIIDKPSYNMYHSSIVCVCVCSLVVCIFFLFYRNYNYILHLNFGFYPLHILNKSSFNNIIRFIVKLTQPLYQSKNLNSLFEADCKGLKFIHLNLNILHIMQN